MECCDFVYICSPLSAPTPEGVRKNMQKASGYADLVRMNLGCRAIAPQSFLPDYLDDNIPVEREAGMKISLCLLQMSKAVVVCGDTVTEEMKREIAKAKEWKIPVYGLVINQSYIGVIRIDEGVKEDEKPICEADLSE